MKKLNFNYKVFLNFILLLCTCITLVIFYFACCKIFDFQYQRVLANNTHKIGTVTKYNYSTILKDVHENIDNYIGEDFSYSGYIYRVPDISYNQFILARDMIISSDFKTVVIGFLCEYDESNKFSDNTWVNISGTIQKGYYYGDIPIVKIKKIDIIKQPQDSLVFPPYEPDFNL